ncbi:MAG TPA: polysaccharide deacetylase family protein [Cytophagaceae bacterium]|jgi:peptidoglycan/xylan/chitin deacetylase (PgdA/CDA1 family)|nr:polysaccharide deacetylase family protein [Cytophagaceae bacterium]
MLTFKKTRALFIIASTIAIGIFSIFPFSWLYLLLLPFLYILILSYGSAFIESGFFIKSICRLDTNEKIIALTFDDGPDPINTPLILDILNKNSLHATFFVIGKKIKENESLLKRIKSEGHIIANHSFSHSYFFDFYPTKKVIADLERSSVLIKNSIGVTPKLFRPPYGVTNPNIARAVSQLHLISIGWNIRSLDTVIKNSDKLYKRIVQRIKPGSIILLHDTGAHTLETLKSVILFAQKNNYKIVRLNEMLSINPYEEK